MRYLLWPDDVIRPRLLSPFDECRRTFGYGPCTDSTGQQNKYELIPTVKMETRHPMKGYFGNEFPSSVITADLWQNSRKTWKIFVFIFGKTTPYGKIFKILFWKDSAPHWSTCRIQISWNLDDRKSVKLCYLPDKKILPGSSTVATAVIAPKICQGQPPALYFVQTGSLSGVIPERVNIIKMGHKANPIFDWSLASSRIITFNCFSSRKTANVTCKNLSKSIKVSLNYKFIPLLKQTAWWLSGR